MKDLFKNRKMLITMFIICALVLIIGGTAAWYVWSSGEENKTVINATMGSATVMFNGGDDLTGQNLKPVVNKEDGIVKTITVQTKNDTLNNISFNLYLDLLSLPDELKDETFKYELYEGATLVTSGNFEEATTVECKVNSTEDTPVNHIVLVDNKTISTTLSTYTLYIWIDGTVDNDPAMAGKDFHFVLHADGQNAAFVEEPETIIEYITNLYTSGNPTLITQTTSNDTYYYSYQDDAQTWGLMNDGLKVDNTLDATTTGLATTVTDTTALTNGTEGNIRYFGPSDNVNNYIYFNCSDYSNQSDSTCEKWRIIGIVDNKVKIIKNDSIGNLAWDQDKNQNSSLTTYNNNWTTSSLQEFLNGLYYNRGTIESHPYYSSSAGTTTTTLNLKTIGITEATRNNNLILESIWYLGGYSTSSGLYPNDIYNYERQNKVGTTIYSTNDFIINKNIGLMYASDYGYGTDLTKCSKDIYNYDTVSACTTGNWLFNNTNQWLITPHSSNSYNAWYVYSTGVRYYSNVYHSSYGVRPVLYLNSELGMESGHEGTSTDPYRISV